MLLALLFNAYTESMAQSPEPKSYLNAARPFPGPQAYKEPSSGMLFYVESDGYHVVAIDKEGKIVWHQDPFPKEDRDLYKTRRIVRIGKLDSRDREQWKLKGDFLFVRFQSSHVVVINIETGACTCLGND